MNAAVRPAAAVEGRVNTEHGKARAVPVFPCEWCNLFDGDCACPGGPQGLVILLIPEERPEIPPPAPKRRKRARSGPKVPDAATAISAAGDEARDLTVLEHLARFPAIADEIRRAS